MKSHVDVSVFSIGGNSLLGYFENAELTINSQDRDGSVVTRRGRSPVPTKRNASLSVPLFSGTAGDFVSHLDVSAFTLGGVDLSDYLRGGSLNITNGFAESSAVGDLWQVPQWVSKDITATVEIDLPDAANHAVTALMDNAVSDLDIALSITINSVMITVPMLISTFTWSTSSTELQRVTLNLKGQDPLTGDYPTAPTGTTSLLEKALNAAGTALAVSVTEKSANGYNYAFNSVIESASFSWNDGELIPINYTLLSTGAVTITTT